MRQNNNARGNPYTSDREYYFNDSYNTEDSQKETVDYLPEGNVLIQQMNKTETETFALGLFDSGSTTPLLNQRALPVGIIPLVGPP